jgi:DNA-binding sugar fermentation-stimulating protein
VGAHPALGERIAELWLRNNRIADLSHPSPIADVQRQVSFPLEGSDGGTTFRADFVVTHANGTRRVVEVKTVVDTDYAASALPATECTTSTNAKKKKQKKQCIFASTQVPYVRTAIFPWGNSNQKGPNGEAVVSARAIRHVQELTKMAKNSAPSCHSRNEPSPPDVVTAATLLFVVVRGDAEAFRPNAEACPSFARYLKEAHDAGVQVLAKRVWWETGGGAEEENNVLCLDDDKILPIEWPSVGTG